MCLVGFDSVCHLQTLERVLGNVTARKSKLGVGYFPTGNIGNNLNYFCRQSYLNSSWETYVMTVAKDAEIGSEKTIYLNILVFYRVSEFCCCLYLVSVLTLLQRINRFIQVMARMDCYGNINLISQMAKGRTTSCDSNSVTQKCLIETDSVKQRLILRLERISQYSHFFLLLLKFLFYFQFELF